MNSVSIYRGTGLVAAIEPDKSSSQVKQIMGDNSVNLVFTLNHYVDFLIGDHCTIFSETYILSDVPVVKKEAGIKFEYTLKFLHEGQDLAKIQFLFLDNQNNPTESEFSLMADAQTFLQLVVSNALRVQPGQWQAGQCIRGEAKLLTFSKESCLSALSKIADAFGTEFWILGKIVHLSRIAINKGYTFKYGQYRGLYEITRQGLSGASVITRLYAYGSDKNLPPLYNTRRLHMPDIRNRSIATNVFITGVYDNIFQNLYTLDFTPPLAPGVTGLTLLYRVVGEVAWNEASYLMGKRITILLSMIAKWEFVIRTEGGPAGGSETEVMAAPEFDRNGGEVGKAGPYQVEPGVPVPFLEKNVGVYGLIEWTEFFEVYPHRTGVVTSVNAANFFEFLDYTMDFDVNAYLLPGATAKVTFNTGQCAGYTFDIGSYDAGSKRFVLLRNKEERNLEIPSLSFQIKTGDEYVITDIQMPEAYITAAEFDLQEKAQAFLDRASAPQYTYTVTVDPLFLKRMQWSLFIGLQVYIKDEQMNIDKEIRVVQTTRSIVNEWEYQVQLADTVSKGAVAQLQAQGASNSQSINAIQQQMQNGTLYNNTFIGDVKVQQGTVVVKDMPQVADSTGLVPVYLDPSTGRLVKVG